MSGQHDGVTLCVLAAIGLLVAVAAVSLLVGTGWGTDEA